MTDTLTARDATNEDMPEINKLASKILGIGGLAVSGMAALGTGKSAGALLFGYATYGAALPLLGYAGIFVAAHSLFRYHGKKLGWDKTPGETGDEPSATVPSADSLHTSINEIKSEVADLNARADALGQQLGLENSTRKNNAADDTPRM